MPGIYSRNEQVGEDKATRQEVHQRKRIALVCHRVLMERRYIMQCLFYLMFYEILHSWVNLYDWKTGTRIFASINLNTIFSLDFREWLAAKNQI